HVLAELDEIDHVAVQLVRPFSYRAVIPALRRAFLRDLRHRSPPSSGLGGSTLGQAGQERVELAGGAVPGELAGAAVAGFAELVAAVFVVEEVEEGGGDRLAFGGGEDGGAGRGLGE